MNKDSETFEYYLKILDEYKHKAFTAGSEKERKDNLKVFTTFLLLACSKCGLPIKEAAMILDRLHFD